LHGAAFEGLFRYAMALVRNRELAEDAIQESFLRYVIARIQGQCIVNGRAWLYRVLRNQLLDARKKNDLVVDGAIDELVHRPDGQQDPEVLMRAQELYKVVLDSVTTRELECLQLRFEGLRYQEIATVLNIRSGTVGAMIARAVKKLQRAVNRERS
jgi:RNA polymerase sigma-70 factor (ECF subfamily)